MNSNEQQKLEELIAQRKLIDNEIKQLRPNDEKHNCEKYFTRQYIVNINSNTGNNIININSNNGGNYNCSDSNNTIINNRYTTTTTNNMTKHINVSTNIGDSVLKTIGNIFNGLL